MGMSYRAQLNNVYYTVIVGKVFMKNVHVDRIFCDSNE